MTDTPTFSYIPEAAHPTPWEEALGLHGARLEVIQRVRAGLPASAFERFSTATGLSREVLAKAAGTSTRTLERRKAKGAHLDQATSERLVRLARLYAQASEVIGDDNLARQWMQTPRSAFSGQTPFEMAQTELGAREVEDLLLRVEYGVFY